MTPQEKAGGESTLLDVLRPASYVCLSLVEEDMQRACEGYKARNFMTLGASSQLRCLDVGFSLIVPLVEKRDVVHQRFNLLRDPLLRPAG